MKRDHDEGIRELTAEEIAAILNLPMANPGDHVYGGEGPPHSTSKMAHRRLNAARRLR
jgi:hypothetical protein